MKGGSLRRWQPRYSLGFLPRRHQLGMGWKEELVLDGVKETLKGLDVNRLIRQGVDEGVQSIDKEAVQRQAKKHFKKGVKKGIKRKVEQSLPGRAVKRIKAAPRKTVRQIRDIFG